MIDTHLKMETESGVIQDSQPVECVKCKKFYKSEYRYKAHVRHVHNVDKIKCDVCGLNISKYLLKKHLLTHEDFEENCKLCGKKFEEWLKCILKNLR